jgi:hypothetical protein
MIVKTHWALLTTEGFTDFESKESDLWGSRGVFLAGAFMLYMALMNFKYTVASLLRQIQKKSREMPKVAGGAEASKSE